MIIDSNHNNEAWPKADADHREDPRGEVDPARHGGYIIILYHIISYHIIAYYIIMYYIIL